MRLFDTIMPMGITLSQVAAVLGWVVVAASMSAYYLVSTCRVQPDSLRYHALNITACVLLAFACFATAAWPSMVANLLFIGIGLRMTWKLRDRLSQRVRTHSRALSSRLNNRPMDLVEVS